ncbi:MAG: Crp/Fnr family transcriptional regulator [Chitinophagaceae bacterium]|nr:Crp/Fnr family transcriptional regulator [Chitinophagaceae bacterium]
MNNFTLSTFLTSNLQVDETTISLIVDHCKTKTIGQGDYLLRQGEYCKHSFFVETGLLRQYSIDAKGKEHILHFAPESWILTDRESVYFNQPSNYFIQALEPTRVALIDEQFIEQLSEKVPSFIDFNNKLLHNHIRHLQNRINQLLSATAEERYLDFIKMYPDILLRVPQIMVASYLGITPESLSRIRKELAYKNFKK